MNNGTAQAILESLPSNAKTFFFHAFAFLVFGLAFLFLFHSLSASLGETVLFGTVNARSMNFTNVDFSNTTSVVKSLVFSYVSGLLLWVFSFTVFKIYYWIISRLKPQSSTVPLHTEAEEQLNDVDIEIFAYEHPSVTEIHTLNRFHSSVIRLLFGLVGVTTLFFAPWFSWLLLLLVLTLFGVGINVDRQVNNFGEQIKTVIKKQAGSG